MGAHLCLRFGEFWLNYAKLSKHAQNQALGALLVATNLLNTKVMSKKPYAHSWAYAQNLIDFKP